MGKGITYIEVKALVHSIFGTELRTLAEAVYLYDSMFKAGSNSEVDSIKLLIVLNTAEPTALVGVKKSHESLVRKVKNRCEVQYQIFSVEPMLSSLDIFPIEFLELSFSRDLVIGRDILADVTIGSANLRQECEFYLRTHVLKLKEGFVRSSMSNSELIRASFPFILSIFKYLLTLLGQEKSKSSTESITVLAERLNFRASVFSDILRDINSPECGVHLFDYISELESITVQVDQMNG